MPPTLQKRRGKPRLETQHEVADIKKDKKKSKLQQIKKDDEKMDDEQKALHEEEEEKKMWSHLKVSKDDPCQPPIVKSEFSTKFPDNRAEYIKLNLKEMQRIMQQYGVNLEADYDDETLTVSTTNKLWDPYAIIKARDFIRLIARYVPVQKASKIMNDDTYCDIIEIGKSSVARNQLRFIKRRARLIGPNGVTLRAIELLTKCYILVYGRTVCAIGDMKGIKYVRKIVTDTMNNVHPIYALKRLMVIKELESNKDLKEQSWDRFLPVFRKIRRNHVSNNKSMISGGHKNKTIAQIKKKIQRKKNKKYTPWPPPPVPTKIDLALESGAYWNKSWRQENLRTKTKEEKHQAYQQRQELKGLKKTINRKNRMRDKKETRRMNMLQPPSETDGDTIKKRLTMATNENSS